MNNLRHGLTSRWSSRLRKMPAEGIGVAFMTGPPDQWHNWLCYGIRTLDTLTRLHHPRRMKRAGEPSIMVAAGPAEVSDSGIRFVSQVGI